MAIFPCAQKGLCIDPSTPFQNFTAEAPDKEIFIGRNTGFGPLLPPLGSDFLAVGCTTFCESTVSQQDADLCAANGNIHCLATVWPTETPGTDVFGNPVPVQQNRFVFRNTAQSATVSCPDGNQFVYTVPAGKYSAFSQALADATALSDAQQNAPAFLVCIGDLSRTQICADEAYTDSVTASGNFLTDGNACWHIIGSLPPGLMTDLNFVDDCFTGSRTLHFFGTPTIPGVYSFGIQVEDGSGDFMVKTLTIRVVGITGVNPMPDGSVGTDYGFQHLNSVGVTNPIFSLEAGALPDGLVLDPTGIIFGTPTTGGTFNFVLGVTEAGTGLTCTSPAAITVTAGGLNFNDSVWTVESIFGAFAFNPDPPVNNAVEVTGTDGSAAAHAFTPNPGQLVNCNVHVKVTNLIGNLNSFGQSQIIRVFTFDGVTPTLIFTVDSNSFNANGDYDFPFTIPATTDAQVLTVVSYNIAFGVSATLHYTFTPAS